MSTTGVGQQYVDAFQAPVLAQDTNALWLLREYGANSPHAWAASGLYPSDAEVSYVVSAVG